MTGGTEGAEQGGARNLREGQILRGGGAIAGAQFVLWWLWWLITIDTRDDYGLGLGGGIAAIGICCLGPLAAVLAGFLHSLVFTWPVTALARTGAARTKTRARWWAAAGLVLLAAGYAWPLARVGAAPYAQVWAWAAAFGVLPLAGVAHAARRGASGRTVMRAAGWLLGFGLLFGFGGGIIADQAGWIRTYEPPRLERTEYVARWTGDDGARLTLRADGSATAERLPRVGPGREVGGERCTGTGTWQFREEGSAGRHETRFVRDGVTVTLPSCDDAYDWQVAGDRDHPELFAAYGVDPDEVRILRRG
ncbi:hypothetical protein ACFWAR_09710 [Streptomyces sp. NPDC059917]|uniref:hypothetical protein n=1 Tax=Streptomyces sp. NPDC059917 TaxID=3347002 RepID=UPI00366A3938